MLERYTYEILSGFTGTPTFQIPIYLEADVDEMGIMVGFDGEMEQIEQFANFTYHQGASSVTPEIIIYNTLNTNKLRTLIDSVYSISWGDGNIEEIPMPTVYDTNLPLARHTYSPSGSSIPYDIEITVNSPWKVEKIKRTILIPLTGNTFPTDLGTLEFTVPYSNPPELVEQDYLMNYQTLTGNTDPVTGVTVTFLAQGKSRIDEFQIYGSSGVYSGTTTGYTEGGEYYVGYRIDDLFYMDLDDGWTMITGNTINYSMEEYSGYTGMITRDEHLIGFLDTPQISSDIFVERGKQGVMERNLRLGEIDSIGELDIYGSGFFKIRKQ